VRQVERQENSHLRPFGEGFCCPYCAAPLAPKGAGLLCEPEGRFFASSQGVYRLLEEKRRVELRPLLELEHRLRRDQGLAAPGHADPSAPHPQAALWRERRERLEEGLRLARQALGEGPWRVLEVGAGSAWAGGILAAEGHLVTAVDASLDPEDGLLAAERLLPRGIWLERAEADMEALPLEPGLFDLVMAVDALHYARETVRTLMELRRVTRRGGALLVLESPVYARRADGEADVARRMRRLRRRYSLDLPRELQPGYLVRPEILSLFERAGYRLEHGGLTSGFATRLLEFLAALLGRGGLPARPVLFALRDG
jgi:SAM-dependent methyltransferase